MTVDLDRTLNRRIELAECVAAFIREHPGLGGDLAISAADGFPESYAQIHATVRTEADVEMWAAALRCEVSSYVYEGSTYYVAAGRYRDIALKACAGIALVTAARRTDDTPHQTSDERNYGA